MAKLGTVFGAHAEQIVEDLGRRAVDTNLSELAA